jgi:hypothetical protein
MEEKNNQDFKSKSSPLSCFKHAKHNKKQGPHSLFLQTGNLPSSSCASIIIFNLTSQIDIEWCRLCCFMDNETIFFTLDNNPQNASEKPLKFTGRFRYGRKK